MLDRSRDIRNNPAHAASAKADCQFRVLPRFYTPRQRGELSAKLSEWIDEQRRLECSDLNPSAIYAMLDQLICCTEIEFRKNFRGNSYEVFTPSISENTIRNILDSLESKGLSSARMNTLHFIDAALSVSGTKPAS